MLVIRDSYIEVVNNTTVPRLFSESLPQNKNKHQIMNVHTKWNCLTHILFGLVKY